MLRPISQELPAAEPPRDCVVRYQIGPNKFLLVSYMEDGKDHEQFQTDANGANERAETALLARARAAYAKKVRDELQRPLRILP